MLRDDDKFNATEWQRLYSRVPMGHIPVLCPIQCARGVRILDGVVAAGLFEGCGVVVVRHSEYAEGQNRNFE